MLLVLPVFVLLLSALGFYALGGGQGAGTVSAAERKPGINTALPGAQLQKDGPADKMGLYEKAQRDSAAEKSHSAAGAFAALGWDAAKLNRPVNTAVDNEKRIQERLAAINQQINQPPQPLRTVAAAPVADNGQAEQLKQLENMLKQKQVESTAPDPQMAQLSAMLDKIKEIQNPALVPDKVRAAEVGAVPVPDSAFKAIPALIDGNQKVAPGGVVKLVLADTVRVAGMLLQKGQLLWGACSVTNQRLLLDIKNIRLGSSIIPVNLTVFSLDGMAGIAAPEAELGAAAGQGADGALQGMQFLSGDYSLGSQAAVAGISAAKGLLGKKAKRIRVKLHGGQQVLLRLNGH